MENLDSVIYEIIFICYATIKKVFFKINRIRASFVKFPPEDVLQVSLYTDRHQVIKMNVYWKKARMHHHSLYM